MKYKLGRTIGGRNLLSMVLEDTILETYSLYQYRYHIFLI